VTASGTAPIVVFGDVCLHVTIRPAGTGEFCPGEVDLGPGGSAAMVALQVAALGTPVAMVGVAGSDAVADDLRDRLTVAGVDCSRWTLLPGATARVAVLVDDNGEHRVVVEQGGVQEPGVALAKMTHGSRATADTVTYVPGFPAYDAARTHLVDHETQVVCDFGFRPWLCDPATAAAQIVPRVAGTAVAVCSGGAFTDADNRALALDCLAAGARAVVTSLGPRGCLVSDADGTEHIPGFDARPKNTLGAGDSFVAGLLTALVDGHPLRQACVFAHAVAATKITTLAEPAAADRVRALLETVRWPR
jgi:ribokinase